ncbi:hypothetical protein HMF8227_01185 [Saliniradius amylolyticus]|uniref:Uncharacterized protein n=1 Tax=Saliniradius amylolyticus TaxID=2183582 RepID=A0A2S2E1Z5_9ALTE|nr:hypothetical protein [Saliniradius amylolyticus]AWL11666.1 hypothetical protein HMF8227_01185 [Saliniradius amylolyticus]
MRISAVEVVERNGKERLTGLCGDFELWFEFPKGYGLRPRADAFVVAAMLPAMQLGQDIRLPDDLPVCPILLENLKQVQDIFLSWSESLNLSLKPIAVTGGDYQSAPPAKKRVAFFSGGVDGTHTYLKQRAHLDETLFAKGIDIQLDNDPLYQQALERNTAYLARDEMPMRAIATNVRYLGYHHNIGWNRWNGAGLASIALAGGVARCYIASGSSYAEMKIEGTSFVTDPLWSSRQTKIIHDGAEHTRLQKLALIARDPDAVKLLRVCWHDKTYNCGECEKCLRTMAALDVLGIHSDAFPPMTTQAINRIRRLRLYEQSQVANWQELYDKLKRAKQDELSVAIGRALKNYYWRLWLRQLDFLVLRGHFRRLKLRLAK